MTPPLRKRHPGPWGHQNRSARSGSPENGDSEEGAKHWRSGQASTGTDLGLGELLGSREQTWARLEPGARSEQRTRATRATRARDGGPCLPTSDCFGVPSDRERICTMHRPARSVMKRSAGGMSSCASLAAAVGPPATKLGLEDSVCSSQFGIPCATTRGSSTNR